MTRWLPNDSPCRIMIVDDEPRVVAAVRRIFAASSQILVKGATSPLQALDMVRRFSDLRLIISDYLMPEMDGLKFLAEVDRLRPQVVRILLTGHADLETALRAINQVGVYKFILKPWNNHDLYWTVMRALELDAARRENLVLQERID
ncbi:MAG TPA: response regulator [Proteobacteria bacterium]|nr:response regulator [Pseudomonadota bacterium]